MSNKERLWKIAKKQHGFFTAKQAKDAGYKDSNFASHLQSGVWRKVGRRIYRLSHFPDYERPELIIWSLWSHNPHAPYEGAWSHETALEIYDLSDVNPTQMHMTVPVGFKNSGKPNFITLHFETLSRVEIQKIDGFFITTPIRTLVDIFRVGVLEPYLLHQSIKEALSKGLITKLELARSKQFYPEVGKIMEIINE